MTDIDTAADQPGNGAQPASGQRTEDAIELMASGKIRVTVAGRLYTLKRPSLGELRQLRELGDEVDVDVKAQAPAETDPDAPPDLAAVRAATRAQLNVAEAGRLRWVRTVFEVLSDHPLPEGDDDLPAWFTSPTLPGELYQQWRSVPLARGVR